MTAESNQSTEQEPAAVSSSQTDSDATDFAHAAEDREPGLIAEFVQFLQENQAWWMAPILLALVVLGVIAWLSTTAAAPFIYPLF